MRIRLIVPSVLALAALVAGQDKIDTLMTKFEEAVKADNYAVMKDLILKSGPDDTVDGYWRYEYQLASAIANKSDEDKNARANVLEKLTSLISQEFKNRMPADRLVWAKALTPELAQKRVQMDDIMREAFEVQSRAEKSGEKPLYLQAIEKYNKAIALAIETKDLFWELQNYVTLGFLAEKIEEKFDSAYYYKRAHENARENKAMDYVAKFQLPGRLKSAASRGLRDDLIDITVPVDESKKRYADAIAKRDAEALNPGGVPGAESKPGGNAAGGPPKPGAAMPGALPPPANKHTMRIEWADADKGVYKDAPGRPMLTPNIRANAHWFFWQPTEIGPTAAKTNPPIVPGDHTFKSDKGKVVFDPDGSGKAAEERLKIALGKPELVSFKQRLFPDGTKVDAKYLVLEEPNAFSVNGVGLSFKAPGPNDPARVRWQGAGAVSSKFDGHDVTIYDDSANGEFNNYGDDSMIIGKGKNARAEPLSRYVYVGDLLFELKVEPNGQNLRFKPYDGPIALVQLEWVGATTPAFLILEGLNENAQFYFNLLDCKDKPIWVPPGEYKFRGGYFAWGEGEKRESIAITNTKSTSFKISEGQLNKVQLGGAKAPGFSCTWKTDVSKDKGKTMIKIRGKDVKVFGCGGEEYQYFFTTTFRPVVKMRSGKEGAIFYEKQMKASAREDVQDGKPWPDVVLNPKDIEVEKAVSGDVFIQLEGDHPKLGKVTSTWTQVE